MVPRPPPREGQLGFLFIPPYRIQGISVAGEEAVVHVPELDLVFDIGLCPRPVLTAGTVCLSHAHMDHVAGLPYWFSQRHFQKLGVGRVLCHQRLVKPLEAMMATWIDLERQKTPHEIIGLEPGQDFRLRPNVVVRGIEVSHSAPSLAFAVVENRSKLREEFLGLPQDKLRELKMSGTEITRSTEIPLVAYTGDTEMGPFLLRDEFVNARIVVTECTFFEPEHRDRAKVGKHIHVEDLRQLIRIWNAPDIVVVHVSRRTNMSYARDHLAEAAGEHAHRIHLLMDHRINRHRYERQAAEAQGALEQGDANAGQGA
ncbi:MAG: MBL fold metallo-hydrolase [Planctomycetaceae bacterium]